MSAKFSFATGEVLQYVNVIKREFHPTLRNSRITVLWREDVDFGHIALAQVIPPVYRFLTNCDAVVFVHKPRWTGGLTEKDKFYYIDHALEGIDVTDKYMDDSRPKLCTVQPEKIGHASVIKRHGIVTQEVKAFAHAISAQEQVNLFELMNKSQMFSREEAEGFRYKGFQTEEGYEFAATPSNDLLVQAARLILERGEATITLLEEELGLSYRMARILMDLLEQSKLVGEFEGYKREILVTEDKLKFFEEAATGTQSAENVN